MNDLFAHHLTELFHEANAKGKRRLQIGSAHIVWEYGPRRLGDACRDQVLTIEEFTLVKRQVSGALARFCLNIIEDHPKSPVPIDFIHFFAPTKDECKILKSLHFTPYRIGDRLDYWHPVTRQQELI